MSASPLASFRSEPSRLIGLRLIPPIETFPRVAAFTQIPAGKLAVGGAFVLAYGCLLPPPGVWPLITFSIGLITFLLTLRWNPVALARLANSAVQPGSLYLFLAVLLGLLRFWRARWLRCAFGDLQLLGLFVWR